MKILTDNELHCREIRVSFEWQELQRFLQTIVAKELNIPDDGERDLVVKFSQLTEGSPSYAVEKWEATVSGSVEVPAK